MRFGSSNLGILQVNSLCIPVKTEQPPSLVLGYSPPLMIEDLPPEPALLQHSAPELGGLLTPRSPGGIHVLGSVLGF